MTPAIRAAALDLVKRLALGFEGLRTRPYLCPAGVPTIAVGATHYADGRAVTLKDRAISKAAALDLLELQASGYLAAVVRLSPILAADPARAAAVADFAFNLGTARYKASTLRRKVQAGQWAEAQRELRKWVWGGGRRLPGLARRRAAEAALLTVPGAAPRPVISEPS